MTWWQTLLVGSTPAVIALCGVLIQLRLTQAAEERRRQADSLERARDRQHESDGRVETRRQVARELTQDRRWEIYGDFLSVAHSVYAACRDLTTIDDVSSAGQVRKAITAARNELTTRMSGAFLLAHTHEHQRAVAGVVSACKRLADRSLADPVPTRADLDVELEEYRTAIKNLEAKLRSYFLVEE
jgi:hypothetical protein